MYKDYIEIKCQCGRTFSKPYWSLQENPPKAPTEEGMRVTRYMLGEELKYHQNNDCPHFYSERKKAELSTKPNPIFIPSQ